VVARGRIFSCVQPSYERAVSDLDRSMHISLRFWVTLSSFIEGLHTTKNMAFGNCDIDFFIFSPSLLYYETKIYEI
jgi:hypothetical protein